MAKREAKPAAGPRSGKKSKTTAGPRRGKLSPKAHLPVKKTAGEKANDAARCEATAVGKMTARERRKALADLAHMREVMAEWAPPMGVVKSDPLRALMLVGAEFIARYFPDATNATFHVTRYPAGGYGPAIYNVMLPMAVPANSAEPTSTSGPAVR